MLNTNYKEYAIHVYENNPFTDGFKSEIGVVDTYEDAKVCAKNSSKKLNEGEHVEIIEIEYDKDGNELSRKFMTGWKAEESEDEKPTVRLVDEHTDKLYSAYIENEAYDDEEDEEEGYSVYILVQKFKDRKKIKTFIETENEDYLYWNSTEEFLPSHPDYMYNADLLADVLVEMKENIEDVVRRRNYAWDNEDMDNIIHRTTLDLE